MIPLGGADKKKDAAAELLSFFVSMSPLSLAA